MSMLVFQNSRRRLLASLMDTFDAAKERRQRYKHKGSQGDGIEERRITTLLKAVEAADAECKKLEFWSDIRKLAADGDAGNATDPMSGWDEKWQGLDQSGAPHP
jgi:hypothetical protein